MSLTLKQYIVGVENGSLDPKRVISDYQKKAQEHVGHGTNAFLTIPKEYTMEHESMTITRPLHGAPIGIKDNILIKGVRATCGSKILENYIAPYTAPCYENLEKAGGLVIGKCNMDEFALGSSNEYSAYGPAKNIYGNNKITGGTSGGPAVAVAADLCLAALGTDTG